MNNREIIQAAREALKKYGANIMPSAGYKDKTWWVEDNGIWGLRDHIPWGLYFTDDELIELAETYTDFKSPQKTTV